MIGVQQVKAYQAPAADGVYYIQNVKTGKFINYGWNFGARIGVDDYGTAWKLIADGDYFKIQAYVTNDRNFQDDTWMYSDGGGDRIRSYIISGVAGEDGVYTLENTSNNQNVYVYLKEDGDKYFVAGNANKGENYDDDDQTYWRFLSQAERDAYIAAQVHEREAAILTNYGLTLPANKTLSEYLDDSPYFKKAEVAVAAMSGWTWTSMPNTNSTIAVSTFDTSALEVYQGEGTNNNKLKLGGTLSKTLDGLSAGLYKVTVPAMYRFGTNADCYANETNGYKGLNGGGYVSAGGNAVPLATWASSCKNNGNPNSPSEFGTIVGEGGYQNVTFANVTGTTLDLAISIPGSIVKGWFCTKQATAIRYNLKTLSDAAIAYPANGELAAGQWYSFTTTTAGDYGFGAIDGIVLTADGSQLLIEATGESITQTKTLSGTTTYYIKSATAQTVTKSGPYTYTIGTATSDKEYVQPGNTVTVSYASMATTNTYASEISTAITGVTLGGEPIFVTRTTKGFTFTVPEVTKGANYTLSIPANIIGYDAPGSGKNEAQEITLKVPVATEGTYYLSTVIAGQRKWLNKNGSGYTYAYDQGLPFTLERNEGSVDTYKLKFSEDDYLNDVGSNWQTKIVGSKNDDWKLQAEDGGYKLLLGVNNACQLFIANTSTGLIEITHSTDDGNIWEFVDPETALNYAIDKAEEHVLGFEAGEYAPYNNTAALAALATAKAATTTDARISAYAALTGATWTANEEDVDAICNGSFTGIARGTQDNVVPGWDGVFRKLVTTEDYAALSASKEGRAMFSHDKTYVYGRQTGYTMPLKRNTKYALSVKAAGWENGNIATVSAVIKKPDGSTLKTLNITPTKRINEAGSLVSGSIDFTVETSGNYTLEVTVPASTLAVITDFSIERLGIPVLMQVSGVAKMGTFCAPFNVVIPDGVKAYTLSDGTSDDWVHMDEVEGTTIAAGTPVLLTSDTKVEQEFVGQMTVLEPDNRGLLKGVFEKTEVASDNNNYILQYQDSKCAFYIVSDAEIFIGKNRCYLHVEKKSPARIAIDREEGGSTAINEVKSVEAEARTMKDGKYFVKGRIIVVKNGKVYGTNGQILN